MVKRLFAVGRARVALFAALTVVLGALISADAFVLQWLIDAVQRQDWDRFGWCVALAATVIALQALVYWWRQTYTERMAYLMLDRLRERLFARLTRVPLNRLGSLSADRLFSQFTAQLEQVKAGLIDVLLYGAALVVQTVFAVTAIMVINPVLGACALVLCVPMALVPVLSKRRVESAREGLVGAQNDLNGELGDLLHGMADWRLMDRAPQTRARLARFACPWLGAARRDAGVQMGVDAITNALSHILVFGIWALGGLLIMNGGMTVAQVVALYALIGNISVPLFQMSGLVAQYHGGRETLRQLEDDIADAAGEAEDETNASADKPAMHIKASMQSNETVISGTPVTSIEPSESQPLEIVESGERNDPHTSASSSDPQPTGGNWMIHYRGVRLHRTGEPFDLDLNLKGRYLLVGPSGSGKSSMIRALVGLDDDYDGQITLDGDDVRSAASAATKRRIGYLSQQSHVFHASIRENVRLFDESISDEAVELALRQAQLGEWAAEHGLDFEVDDSLNALSGGERQRLLLARVLAQGYDFCLLDEFDTGLDAATAALIEQVICRSFTGFIAITHRPGRLLAAQATSTLHMEANTLTRVTVNH